MSLDSPKSFGWRFSDYCSLAAVIQSLTLLPRTTTRSRTDISSIEKNSSIVIDKDATNATYSLGGSANELSWFETGVNTWVNTLNEIGVNVSFYVHLM